MNRYLSFIILGLLIASSCTKDITSEDIQVDINLKRQISSLSPTGNYDYYILPKADELNLVPQDPRNVLTAQKVELGKMLFFETGLAQDANFDSGRGTYSCASCHIPSAGFRPGAPQGVAEVWDLREDTELNHLGYAAIETQNIEGIKTHRIKVDKDLLDEFGYTSMFDNVFPDIIEEERYSQFAASLALSAYIRSIIGDEAPFQKWLEGDLSAMSYQEKEGMGLFFGKARCANCHYEQNLGSQEFHALGVKDMYQRPSYNTSADDRRNLGRGGFTLKEEDNYKFKVPGLYNASDAPFYFHGASKNTLYDVIDYKIQAQTENYNCD